MTEADSGGGAGNGGSVSGSDKRTRGMQPVQSTNSAAEAPTDERASAAFDGSFDECVAALKKGCGYDV